MNDFNIFLIGFSSYERSTIETFFRLAGRRAPHWALTPLLTQARVVLFNATSQQDADNVQTMVASWQKIIIVGTSDYGTGWPVLPRPIKLTVILSLLDDMARLNRVNPVKDHPKPMADERVSAVVQAATQTVPVAIASTSIDAPKYAEIALQKQISPSIEKATPQPVVYKKTEKTEKIVETVKSALVPLNEAPSFNFDKTKTAPSAGVNVVAHSVSPSEAGRVLLVDDSDIALKHMQNRMRHFGYECDLASSGEEALAMVSSKNYHFVFLDVMMTGLDGYQTCKAIKNNKARRGPPPVVVMLTSRGSTIDKIRGAMAGCDAYLTKPLNDKRMASIVAKFDKTTVTERWAALSQPFSQHYPVADVKKS